MWKVRLKSCQRNAKKNRPTPTDLKRAVAYDFPNAELTSIELIQDSMFAPHNMPVIGRLEFIDGDKLVNVWLTINDFKQYTDDSESCFFHDEYGVLDYVCAD